MGLEGYIMGKPVEDGLAEHGSGWGWWGGGGPWEKFRAWELLLPGEKALQSLLSKIPGNIGPAHSILLHGLGVSP